MKRWMPKEGEQYFYININNNGLSVNCMIFACSEYHINYVEKNNCFRTYDEVEEKAENIRKVLKGEL